MPPKYKIAQRKPDSKDFPGLGGESVSSTTTTAGGSSSPPVSQDPPKVFEEDDDDDDDSPSPPSNPNVVVPPSPEPGMTPAASTTTDGSKLGSSLTCDLCNGDVKEGQTLDEHILACHPALVSWCDELLQAKPLLSDPAASEVNPITILSLGKKAKELASALDKGPATFNYALDGRKQLALIAQQKFSRCDAYMFGSCVALGVWDGDGDVDLTIVDPKGWTSDPQTWPGDEASIVMKLTRCLRDSGFAFEDLEPVRHTRVPIVRHKSMLKAEKWRFGDRRCNEVHIQLDNTKLTKQDKTTITNSIKGNGGRMVVWEGNRIKVQCTDGNDTVACRTENIIGLPRGMKERYRTFPDQDYKPPIFYMDFDVSSRAHGVRNSFLLRGYFKQNPLFRAGSIFVKKWSKASGVNNSRKGYLTSYAVNILWLYYLVQKDQASFFKPTDIPVLPANQDAELTYMPIFPNDTVEEQKALGELLTGFFRFYAVEFDWEANTVSLNERPAKSKSQLKWTEDQEIQTGVFRDRIWYRLCIEDPYEPNLNLGRHVSPPKMKKLMGEFLFAYHNLVSGKVNEPLRDRSSDKVKERMTFLIKKSMIGKPKRSYPEVISEISKADPASWAAFQVEHKANKLLDLADFNYVTKQSIKSGAQVEGGEGEGEGEEDSPSSSAQIVYKRPDECIPEDAREEVEHIESLLRQNPTVGIPLNELWHSKFLDTLFLFDFKSDALFLEEAHIDKLYEYRMVLEAVMREEYVLPLNSLCDDVKKRMRGVALPKETIEAVVQRFTLFQYDPKRGLVLLNTSKTDPVVGDCKECRMKRVKVWGERPGDKEMYCQECWRRYSGK